MATYVYETIPANPDEQPRRFEVQQKMSDPPLKTDPQTGEPVTSILSMKTRGR
jgi:predicted nucleic acid-binding Zn ribbon protein